MSKEKSKPVKNCGNCKYSKGGEVPDRVYCIKGPPLVVKTNTGTATHFPEPKIEDFCFDHEPVKAA